MAKIYNISKKKPSIFFSGLNVNITLILINVVLFFFLYFFPSDFILKNIAISLQNVRELRLWTFLTSMFMHGNFFHLFANMFSLLFIGSLIERILGKKRYLWFYLIAGLFGGLLYILFESFFPSNLPAVGASGAIFGVAGLMVILTPNLPLYIMFIPIPIKAKYAIPGLLIVLWLISITGTISIGNTAHLGGLIVGLIYGIYLKNKYKNKTRIISRYFS